GLFADRTQLRALVLSYGDLAPVVFIGLQISQVVISFIPGEATGFLGGFLFGVLEGFVYSCIGLSIGSLMAFGLSRWLGMRFVRRIVRPELYQKFAFLQEPRGIIVVFIFFLIPGFPKDTLSYILGVTPIPVWAFFVTMTIGRMPGTWLLSLQGAKFQAGESSSVVLLVTIGAFLVLMGYFYRDRIMEHVRRHWGDFR
ncbi:MAG: TVP38/TMEM64 family protein, partial [Candidatus Methylomirabilales bacterium]